MGLLCSDDVRLLTLTGPGGTGKTRLAFQAAAERVDRYAQGVWFVNLAALTNPDLVVPTIAQTLAVTEQPGESIEETLSQRLREQEVLLLLDNFEQVAGAAPRLAALLASSQRLNLLVTSRASLHLSGEHEYAVPPLANEEALALFAERAQAAKANFALNGNRAVIAQICRRLDHLPLAIELAAARIKLLPENALLARLDERLKLLTGGALDLDERQRTLRAAIDWSYNLLTEEEQTLFRRLAVFAGGRTLEAIEAVCNVEGDLDVFEGVASLVDKSLLRQDETEEGEPRYVMLETIHEHARERLEETIEAEELRERHAQYFLTFARENAPHLGTSITSSALKLIDVERDNFRAADAYFERREEWTALLSLGVALARWRNFRGLTEAQSRLERALEETEEEPTAERELARLWLGNAAYGLRDYTRAVQEFEGALTSARGRNDIWMTAQSTSHLAMALDAMGEHARSIVLQEELLASRDLDPHLRARATVNLAYALLCEREYEAAKTRASEALRLAREMGDSHGTVVGLTNLGLAQLALGDTLTSAEHLREALRLAVELEALLYIPPCLVGIASTAAAAGDQLHGAALLGASAALCDQIGAPLESEEAALYDRTEESLRTELGDVDFMAEWEQGKSLDLEDLVALVFGASS